MIVAWESGITVASVRRRTTLLSWLPTDGIKPPQNPEPEWKGLSRADGFLAKWWAPPGHPLLAVPARSVTVPGDRSR